MSDGIYFDNNATTFLDPDVRKIMIEILNEDIANPSSAHTPGRKAHAHLNKARREVASFLGVKTSEIVFTSGGTEGLNMVIRGIMRRDTHGHIITSDGEHAAVQNTVKDLERDGYDVTRLSIGKSGAVTAEAVRGAIRDDTKVIALMAVNNETGIKTDIEAVAAVAQEKGIPFIVDAVALMGKELFTIPEGVTALCISGHKFHAPKGVGAVFLRATTKMSAMIFGGEQEYHMRGGTENVVGIIGLGEACRQLRECLPEASERMARLRDMLEEGIATRIPNAVVHKGSGERVVNTTNIAFPGVQGETLLIKLDQEGLAVSHGSACAAGALEPSRVLLNMGIPREEVRSSLRFSLCRMTTEAEVKKAIEIITNVVERVRSILTQCS
jgi:cysteine desulfurase